MPVKTSHLRTPYVRQFLQAFDMDLGLLDDLEALVEACSSRNKRFERGMDKVRFEFERDQSKWNQSQLDAIFTLSERWRMRHGETPFKEGSSYDLIVTMGGARLSPWQRGAYAALAMSEGRVKASTLVIGGSKRHLPMAELPFITDYVDVERLVSERNHQTFLVGGEEKSCITEHDLCLAAEAKLVKAHPDLHIVTICVDMERAGNHDVIAEVMNHKELFHSDRALSVAGVSTQLYATGLDADLWLDADTHDWRYYSAIGHPVDPIYSDRRTPTVYFNEIQTTMCKKALAELKGY
ncbi:MAG: hypothetical protein WC080_04300 [Patescibacteria group bacterium]